MNIKKHEQEAMTQHAAFVETQKALIDCLDGDIAAAWRLLPAERQTCNQELFYIQMLRDNKRMVNLLEQLHNRSNG